LHKKTCKKNEIDFANFVLPVGILDHFTITKILQAEEGLMISFDENNVIPKELVTFQKRMIKYRNYIFTFLYFQDVPPDNNASERAIRNIKVKQKISGQFKTANGAQPYAIIRSITDTCIKNNQNILAAFKTIANLQPE
jgi:hypothetical protein